MKNKSKSMLAVVGEHILYIFLSMILIGILYGIFAKCPYVVSIITILIYISSIYSAGWHQSGKDLRFANEFVRLNPQKENPYRRYNGFIIALPLFLISALLFVMRIIFANSLWVNAAFRIFNAYSINLFDLPKTGLALEILATVLPFVSYGLGYVAGKDKKVFVTKHLNKLIYKKKIK